LNDSPAAIAIAIPVLLSALLVMTAHGAAAPSAAGESARVIVGQSERASDRVEQLIASMTLEEKVGQMTQLSIEAVSFIAAAAPDGRHALDPDRLRDALVRHHVGSLLNAVPHAFDIAHWHDIIRQIQDVATKETRLGIPVIYGIDSIHGASYSLGATLFPQPIALAATWNADLVERVARVGALETRASGIPWSFFPVCDIGRQPAWPRLWETFGEDVHLASSMVSRTVAGLQDSDAERRAGVIGPEQVAATLKHFAGYSMPLSGKDRTPVWIDERMLRQFVLPSFEAGIRAGALTVMANSGEVNGIPGHANRWLLTDILKDEWGFQGFVVSDWQDIKRLHTRDRVAETPKEAVRLAVMAGVDMSMVPDDLSFPQLLAELVREGAVPEARIDDAVRRILRVKETLGLFEDPYPDPRLVRDFAAPASSELNLQAARESITLLKNDGDLLPLDKTKRLLVTGPAADRLSVLNGGWTIVWKGDREDLYPKDKPTIRGALAAALGPANVVHVPGSGFDAPLGPEQGIDAALAAARDVDAVVVCLGEPPYVETDGNLDDLTLDPAQLDLAEALIEALAGTGKPVILVLVEGRPRVVRRIVDRIPAILMAYLPGMEGGRAIAEVLLGDVDPSGRLPFSYPRGPNAVVPYDYKPAEEADGNRYAPEFPFGHGLGYTRFAYSDLQVRDLPGEGSSADAAETAAVGSIEVSVRLRNVGTRAGLETVALYVTDLYGSVSRPNRELKAFHKIALEPGEEAVVRLDIDRRDLRFVGLENRRVFEPGRFRFAVGELSQELDLR
jgi:beta-glucosidase